MQSDTREQRERRATYLTLTGVFLSVFAFFAGREQRRGEQLRLGPMEFTMLALAAFRGGRLVAWDHVGQPLRAPFTQTMPDQSGAGDNVEPAGTGARQALGQLFSCPICSGTWVTAALVYGLRVVPGPTRLLMAILAATGAVELLHGAGEALTWQASLARQQTGRLMRRPARAVRRLPVKTGPGTTQAVAMTGAVTRMPQARR